MVENKDKLTIISHTLNTWMNNMPMSLNLKFWSRPIGGASSLELSFKYYVNHYSGINMYTLKVQVSTDKENWTTVWEVTPDTSIPATEVIQGLPSSCGAQTFYIAWVFEGDSYNINYWYIDGILVK